MMEKVCVAVCSVVDVVTDTDVLVTVADLVIVLEMKVVWVWGTRVVVVR